MKVNCLFGTGSTSGTKSRLVFYLWLNGTESVSPVSLKLRPWMFSCIGEAYGLEKKVNEISCWPWSRKYSMENRGKRLWKSSLEAWNGSGAVSGLLLQLWEISRSEPYTSASVNKSLRIIYSCCVCRFFGFFFCHHIGRADSFRKRHSYLSQVF